MAPPRPIEGTVGSRIRVILGKDGNSWLLLLDHDDGNRKWQSKNWKSIPSGLAKQINNCTAKGRDVKFVDFGPNDSWYVQGVKPDGSDTHHRWGGLDAINSSAIKEMIQNCALNCKIALGSQHKRASVCLISGTNGYTCINTAKGLSNGLKRVQSRQLSVRMIRLFNNGQFCIEDEGWRECQVSNPHFDQELKKMMVVEDIAMAEDGSWIVIRSSRAGSGSLWALVPL